MLHFFCQFSDNPGNAKAHFILSFLPISWLLNISLLIMSLSQHLSLLGLVILLLSPICTPATSSISNDVQCAALSKLLPSKVFYPNSSSYVSSISSYFYVATRLTPSCVITPTSTADVAIIVKTLKSTYQKHPRPLFAIRGGGHSPDIAAANINQGITVDMRALKAIRVGDDGNITSVGAGALWNDVYSALDTRNLSAVGGRVAGVGVGGLITGGIWPVSHPNN